jgi:hypothetical protein
MSTAKSWPDDFEEIEERVRRSVLTRPRSPIVIPKEVFEMLILDDGADIVDEYKNFATS